MVRAVHLDVQVAFLSGAVFGESSGLAATCSAIMMRIMKWQSKLVLILLSGVSIVSCAQPPVDNRKLAQQTQERDYWVDPSTGLMWAAKDNGKDVSWGKAMKYCHSLKLARYSDWRLATLAELQGIYDEHVNTPGLARLGGPARGSDFTWHVKGNLFLTGNQWSSKRRLDDRGRPLGYEYFFDFNEGRFDNEPSGWPYPSTGMRALCVRPSAD